jgi:hypothetical protein
MDVESEQELKGFSDATDVGKLKATLKIGCRTDQETHADLDLGSDRNAPLKRSACSVSA